LVGVCSYLLVHFWFTRIAAVKSAMNAMFTNRVGDFFLTIGFFAIFFAFGTLDYGTVFALSPYMNIEIINFILILLLLGAAAKSAQLALHVWLPMAMEGPTPVSALIHAATMVTAGVYLLMRCSPLLEQSQFALLIVTMTGALTSFFGASVGLFQNDIKKVIAYSTMSQLARECIKKYIFRQQTICVKLLFFYICNSQITKAHVYNIYKYNNSNFFNSFSGYRQYFYIQLYNEMSEKWKIIIISKLVGISEAIRLLLIIYLIFYYVFYTHKIKNFLNIKLLFLKILLLSYIIKILNIRNYSLLIKSDTLKFNINLDTGPLHSPVSSSSLCCAPDHSKFNNYDKSFFEWLAGVIDGDGYFNLSKKGNARLQITMDLRDIRALYEIKQKLGGSIRSMANANALRYQLSHKKGLITLLKNINGLIRNPVRLLQMNKICIKYGINVIFPKPLIFNNGWFSGFIDSDGSIYLNEKSGQIFISISQKNKYLLDPLVSLYGGRVYFCDSKFQSFKYVIYRKKEIFNLIDNYFIKYKLKTKKFNRLNLIKQFYIVNINKDNNNLNKLNEWVLFKDKWDKYND